MSKESGGAIELGDRPEYGRANDASLHDEANQLAAMMDSLFRAPYYSSDTLGRQVSKSSSEKVEIARVFSDVLEDSEQRYVAQITEVEFVRTESRLTEAAYRLLSRWVLVDDMCAPPVELQSRYELAFHGIDLDRVTSMQVEFPNVLSGGDHGGVIESRPMLPYDRACLRAELTTLLGRLGCVPPGSTEPN